MKKYAISDIHGCLKTLEKLLEKINFTKNDSLYLLGDLIDRGPDSKGVIDFIWNLQDKNYQVYCLRGNHEQMMFNAFDNINFRENWFRNGGRSTLRNFETKSLSGIPKEYFNFINALPYYFEVDEYILVHAGFSFDMPNPFDEIYSMLWQRNWYDKINNYWLGDRIIIHGHTPIIRKDVNVMLRDLRKNQYLNIDLGCVHKGKVEGLGYLACFDLGKRELIFQENLDF